MRDSRDILPETSRVRREFRGPLSRVQQENLVEFIYFTHQKLVQILSPSLSFSLPSLSQQPPFFPPRISTFRFDRKCPPQGYPKILLPSSHRFPTLKTSLFHFRHIFFTSFPAKEPNFFSLFFTRSPLFAASLTFTQHHIPTAHHTTQHTRTLCRAPCW